MTTDDEGFEEDEVDEGGTKDRESSLSVRELVLLVPLCFVAFLLLASGYIQNMPCAVLSEKSSYDELVLNDKPIAYYTLGDFFAACDYSINGLHGSYFGSIDRVDMPNGDKGSDFDGLNSYAEIADNELLSVPTSGILTVEAWVRVKTTQFKHFEKDNYVHFLGKGDVSQQEYAMRMYSLETSSNRPNRIAGYAFNLTSGQGIGSYFQDPISTDEWILVTLVINTKNRSAEYPSGYTMIYKNGVFRDRDSLANLEIVPKNENAPLRLGTRDFHSFFEGAIGKVAVYDYELQPEQVLQHYNLMYGRAP